MTTRVKKFAGEEEHKAPPPLFASANKDAIKAQVKEASRKHVYNVSDFYNETGFMQRLARSRQLETFKMFVTMIYAVWAAIDVDNNEAKDPMDANIVFVAVTAIFCAIFCIDVLIRFAAFRRKADCLRDSNFLVDLVLSPLVIVDLWAPILRFFQIIIRMRMIVRQVPEVAIILKGMISGLRSTFFCILLEFFFTYLFGLAMTILTRDTQAGEMLFTTVLDAMHTLLVHGILFGAHAEILHMLNEAEPIAEVFLLVFIVLSWSMLALTFGTLCEIVSVVAAVEKEQLTVEYSREKLTQAFVQLDIDGSGTVSKAACEQVVVQPETARIMQEIGVDVVGFVDSLDTVFGEDGNELIFDEFLDLVLSMRGTNHATVKDIMDVRKLMMSQESDATKRTQDSVVKPLDARMKKVEDLLKKLVAEKEEKETNQKGEEEHV